ncbi:hypothetical protein AVEN_244623-1 [Araneus ventricosus]|uniref:Uncharacterized protein n=1 Tax=Araneus ventricosus TaxID=182803 RepID=A0A4Y2IN66_ARAVE|nr:hypothetical protein AVEN_244623-1 [Araneus ventricosus]
MSNTEALQWVAEVDDSLARNEILTDDEIIRTVAAEDGDDDDVTPVNLVKISHSEAVAVLNTSLQWAEEQNFEAHENMPLGHLRDRAFELKIGTAAQNKNNDFLDTDYNHSLTYVVIIKEMPSSYQKLADIIQALRLRDYIKGCLASNFPAMSGDILKRLLSCRQSDQTRRYADHLHDLKHQS